MKNKTKNYNLLEDYGKDKLPFLERFNLEKEALDDDFLFEAIEGYANSNHSDLQKVEKRFALIVKQNNDGAIVRKLVPYRWIAGVAASVLLFSAVTYIMNSGKLDSSEPDSENIVENITDPFSINNQEAVGEANEMAMLAEVENQGKESSVDPNNGNNSLPPEQKNVKEKPKPELKIQLKSEQMALAVEKDAVVQKLSDGIEQIENKEETAAPTSKAPAFGKESFGKASKAVPTIAMELNKEKATNISDENLNEQATSELSVLLKEEFKKNSDLNFPNTDMNMILNLSEDSLIKEAIFISGCRTCFDTVLESLVGKKIDSIDANQVGKKLIFRFKSK